MCRRSWLVPYISVAQRWAVSPNGHISVAQLGDLDIDFDEGSPHEAPHDAHADEDGHVPDIVEHTRAVEGQAVCIQTKVAEAPKVGCQDGPGVLLQQKGMGLTTLLRQASAGAPAARVAQECSCSRGWWGQQL